MKKRKIIYSSILVIILALTLYLSYIITLPNINKNFIHLITKDFNEKENTYKIDIASLYINCLKDKNHFKNNTLETDMVTNIAYNTTEPIVYIYNTHSNEEYSYQKNDIYNITPNVKTASYILEDELKKLGINSIVEKENTIDIVNNENLQYKDSYKISRRLLENQKLEHDSLIYFIDLHRDSVSYNITTADINGEKYAKVMFLLGLENENYLENKQVMTSMNNYLNENYQGLSRGIYEKKGAGVNGVYNQDFNKNTILIEVGGVDNSLVEVSNSLKVIASMLYNYINENK